MNKQRYEELHRALDELVAAYIAHTGKFPAESTILSLIEWSHQRMISGASKPP